MIGYRLWKVSGLSGSPQLGAFTRSSAWSPGVNAARCGATALQEGPNETCSCGLYAFSTPEFLHEEVAALIGKMYAAPMVAGEIEAHGRIQRHERGFRAQFARVKRLYVEAGGPTALKMARLAAEYDVSVIERSVGLKYLVSAYAERAQVRTWYS